MIQWGDQPLISDYRKWFQWNLRLCLVPLKTSARVPISQAVKSHFHLLQPQVSPLQSLTIVLLPSTSSPWTLSSSPSSAVLSPFNSKYQFPSQPIVLLLSSSPCLTSEGANDTDMTYFMKWLKKRERTVFIDETTRHLGQAVGMTCLPQLNWHWHWHNMIKA